MKNIPISKDITLTEVGIDKNLPKLAEALNNYRLTPVGS